MSRKSARWQLWTLGPLLWLAAATSGLAQPVFKSPAECGPWIDSYYQHPEPARVVAAVKCLSDGGVFDNGVSIPPLAGFLSGVFRANPGMVNSWVDQLGALEEKHLRVVFMGIWYANLPDSKRMAMAFLERHPALRTEVDSLLKGAPTVPENLPLEQGAWVLDTLWGKFLATGDAAPVERIIGALAYLDAERDKDRLVIGATARWSLFANAKKHARVLEICQKAVGRQTAAVDDKLKEVINAALSEIKPAHSAEPAAGWLDKNGRALPDTESQKSKNNFSGMLMPTTDPNWEKEWDTPPEVTPKLMPGKNVKIGKQISVLTFFSNPKADENQEINVICTLKVTRPNGTIATDEKNIRCGKGKLGGDPHGLWLSPAIIKFIGQKSDPLGKWLVEADITDVNRDTTLRLKTDFQLEAE